MRRTAEDGDRQPDDETEVEFAVAWQREGFGATAFLLSREDDANDFGPIGGPLSFTTLPWEAFHRRMSAAGFRIESGATIAEAVRKCNAPRATAKGVVRR